MTNHAAPLTNKVTVITGAASGVGLSAARLFAEAGAYVVLADRDEAGLRKAEESLPTQAQFLSVVADVADANSVESCIETVLNQCGRIDVLFNNAGIGPSSDAVYPMRGVVDTPAEAWSGILAVNLIGPALMCRSVIPVMAKAGGGSIINNASINALVALPGADAYTASKGGLVAITRTMAVEWAAHRIRVNCLCPGPIETPMGAPWLDDPDKRAYLDSNIPLGRIAQPADIANVALFLASDASAYLNGAVIPVDGGWTAA